MRTAQPAGLPEICKQSLLTSPVTGGQELFVIGKNFMRGTKVYFEEKKEEDVVWSQEAVIDSEHFSNVSSLNELISQLKVVGLHCSCMVMLLL